MRFPVRALLAMVGLGWIIAQVAACGQQGSEYGREERPMADKTIEAVLMEHTERLMSLPGVVGTALGECSGQPCIRVFVAQRTPGLLKQIPSAIEGYEVTVQETGEISALDSS